MIREKRPKKLPYSLELNRVIFWCLEKNPMDRPSISDLVNCPEITLKIRNRRYEYQRKYVEKLEKSLLQREEKLRAMEREMERKKLMLS